MCRWVASISSNGALARSEQLGDLGQVVAQRLY
jgi:hypothetical protein